MKLYRAAAPRSIAAVCFTLIGMSTLAGCILDDREYCNRHPGDPHCSYVTDDYRPPHGGGSTTGTGGCAGTGGTAATGTVEEPQASWATVANDNLIFQALLSGKTWAEAAWGATKQLGYVNTAVGDPLMTWKQLLAGDVTRDGVVDMLDLAMLGSNWGSSLTSGGDGWTSGDLNSDGVVDVLDLALLGSTWGQTSSWAEGQALMADSFVDFPFAALFETSMPLVPEPSSATLMTLAGVSLGGCAAYRRRKRARLIVRTSASAL